MQIIYCVQNIDVSQNIELWWADIAWYFVPYCGYLMERSHFFITLGIVNLFV